MYATSVYARGTPEIKLSGLPGKGLAPACEAPSPQVPVPGVGRSLHECRRDAVNGSKQLVQNHILQRVRSAFVYIYQDYTVLRNNNLVARHRPANASGSGDVSGHRGTSACDESIPGRVMQSSSAAALSLNSALRVALARRARPRRKTVLVCVARNHPRLSLESTWVSLAHRLASLDDNPLLQRFLCAADFVALARALSLTHLYKLNPP